MVAAKRGAAAAWTKAREAFVLAHPSVRLTDELAACWSAEVAEAAQRESSCVHWVACRSRDATSSVC